MLIFYFVDSIGPKLNIFPSFALCHSLSYSLQTEDSRGRVWVLKESQLLLLLFTSPQLIRTWNALNGVTVAKDVL